MGERLRWAFAVGGVVGAAIGDRWGQVERVRSKIAATARRQLIWAFGYFVAYLVLENGLPKLGRILPVIYEDPYFWSLVAVRVVLWGLFIGTLSRLFASLRPGEENASTKGARASRRH
jgi:hypothetical protein